MTDECCLGFVFLGELELIIALESIHKGEEHVDSGIIDQGIDMWQWKVILGVGLVQILVVFAYAYFPIFLRHRNNVGNPI